MDRIPEPTGWLSSDIILIGVLVCVIGGLFLLKGWMKDREK